VPSLESKLTKAAPDEELLELDDELLDEALELLELDEELLELEEELELDELLELEEELELDELLELEEELELDELLELEEELELDELLDDEELEELLDDEELELDELLELEEPPSANGSPPQAAIDALSSAKVNACFGKRVNNGNLGVCIVFSQVQKRQGSKNLSSRLKSIRVQALDGKYQTNRLRSLATDYLLSQTEADVAHF